MRNVPVVFLASVFIAAVACGGGASTPSLDVDCSAQFVGTWIGTATAEVGTRQLSSRSLQPIARTDVNRLSLRDFCSAGVDASATVISASEFSIDAITCPPEQEACGPVTLTLERGSGRLDGAQLTFEASGTASGCGISYSFKASFAGTLTGSGPPTVSVPSTSVWTNAGKPVALTAAASDPDGLPLQIQWDIVGSPSGSTPSLTQSSTTSPVFSAAQAGAYTVRVTATARDGQTASATVEVDVRANLPVELWVDDTTLSTTLGTPVPLSATAIEPNGLPLSIAWTVIAQPVGASPTLNGATSATPVFTSSMPGNYQVQVVATSSDGDSATASVEIAVISVAGSYVTLQSDSGDYIGGGRSYAYAPDATTTLSVTASHGLVTVHVQTADLATWWSGDFLMPGSVTRLSQGEYDGLTRYPFNVAGAGGLSWSGDGRGCNTLTGWFAIDRVTYLGDALTGLDLRFEQHCEGASPALHGQIHWGD